MLQRFIVKMKYVLVVVLIFAGQVLGNHNGTQHPEVHHNGTKHPDIQRNGTKPVFSVGSKNKTLNETHHNWFQHNQVHLRYCTWFPSENRTLQNCIKLGVPTNTSFYDVMTTAQTKDPKRFGFESTLYPSMGHYITSIGGAKQNTSTGEVWYLYVLKQKPNMYFPPRPEQLSLVGVDRLIVQPRRSYLFWLHRQQSNPPASTVKV